MKKFKLEKQYHRMKISQYLREVQNYSGRSLRNVEVFLNGKQVRTTKKLPSGGILKVIEKSKVTDIKPIKLDLDIVYEDADLLIVNKEPFLLTHPTQKKADFTLANGIVHYFKEKYGEERIPRFYNRLDMNTSGLIIIAKNSFAQAFLQNFSIFEKKYLAIVDGIMEIGNEIIIEKPIYRDGDKLERIIDERGQYAKTAIRFLKKYDEKNVTLVECELFTGRTHQIRVHLRSVGHPIIGDELYGKGINPEKGIKRQFLHAYKVRFTHPSKNEEIELEIPISEDMKKFLER
ncbi:RluA family pseudouridine synthase [Leptotrichia sp. OH3620_COT-345]|uniref:RluA family pseudouridine synthase n=1 Tax=Leptotrichia sp. OH3620_COT-345 TaxID=2491048 RepID=UPI000F645343|nr:RluA family pseudouridine synthase [Leptotrichia sp. OH3620_COT-345]RRD40706.1 RluA family pseudouridine synthase [Leptotrichia sp. OH3620_COT-345]